MMTLGGYQLDRILAKGGMAEVWLAHKNGLGGFSKQVVVKRVLPHLTHDEAFMKLFLKEARVAALFSHVNLVQIFELGQSEGGYFIAMEYVRGTTLRGLQRACYDKNAGLPLNVLSRIIFDACTGLHYAHDLKNLKGRSLDLVHLDVSPENLLISMEGITKVSDFGVARAREGSQSLQRKDVLGKVAYMAPEQAAGTALDRRADIYALGAITFELVSGRVPIEIDSGRSTITQLLETQLDFSDVRDVCPALESVLVQALAAKPDHRPPSALAFAQLLVDALGAPASYAEVAECLAALLAPSPVTPAATHPPTAKLTRPRSTQRLTRDG